MEFIRILKSRLSSLFWFPGMSVPEALDKYSCSALEFTIHVSTVHPHRVWNMKSSALNSVQGSYLLPHLWALISTASAVLLEEPQSWGNLSVSELGLILQSLTKLWMISGAVLEEVTVFIEMENNLQLQIFLFICSHTALTQQSFSVLLLGEGFLYEGLIRNI